MSPGGPGRKEGPRCSRSRDGALPGRSGARCGPGVLLRPLAAGPLVSLDPGAPQGLVSGLLADVGKAADRPPIPIGAEPVPECFQP